MDAVHLLEDFVRADRKAVEHDLLDGRDELRIQEALASLQAEGISPAKLEAWLSGTSSEPLTAAAENFQAMLSSLKSADQRATKEAFRKIAAQGQETVKHSFAALNFLGYDANEVHSWLVHGDVPAPQPRKQKEEPTLDVYHLLKLLRESDEPGVKNFFADLKQKGGKERSAHALARLENLGYNANVLKQWLEKPASPAKPARAETSVIQNGQSMPLQDVAEEDAKNLQASLQASDKLRMKKELARMLQEGGEKRLSKGLLHLHHLGFDIDAVKKWYISAGEEASPKPLQTAPEVMQDAPAQVYTLNMRKQSDVDAELMVNMIENLDKDGLGEALRNMNDKGGRQRLENALDSLQSFGYDAQEMQLWLAANGLPPKRSKRPVSLLAIRREDPQEKQAHIDAQLLKTDYMRSDAKGLRTILELLEASGGKDRVDSAFMALREEFQITEEAVKKQINLNIVASNVASGVLGIDTPIPAVQATAKTGTPAANIVASNVASGVLGIDTPIPAVQATAKTETPAANLVASNVASGVLGIDTPIPAVQATAKIETPADVPAIDFQKVTLPQSLHVERPDAATQPAVVVASQVSEPQHQKVDQPPGMFSAPQRVKVDPLRLRRRKVAAGRAVRPTIMHAPQHNMVDQRDRATAVSTRKVDLRMSTQSNHIAAAASAKKNDPPASKSTMQHFANKPSGKPSEEQHKLADSKSNKQVQRPSDAQSLERYILRKDRGGMKTALQNILKVGGAEKVTDAFVVLESMKYNPEELQRWIMQGGEVPVKMISRQSNKGDSHQAANLPNSEWSPVKDALDTLINFRHSAGEWLDFSKHVSKDQIKNMLESSNGLEESDVGSKLPNEDAQALDKYLRVDDIRSTKRHMKDMLIDGGLSRVESALGELQALGYDPVEVQKLLEGDASSPIKPKMGSKHKEQFSKEISEEEDVLSPVKPKSEAVRKEQFSTGISGEDDVSSLIEPESAAEHEDEFSTEFSEDEDLSSPVQTPTKEQPPMVAQAKAANQAQIDAQILEGDLTGADGDDMKQELALLNSDGGEERVQAALGQLHAMGYNPSSVQNWLAGTERLPVKQSNGEPADAYLNKSEEPSSVHDRSAMQMEADEDVDASLEVLLKKASMVQAEHMKAPHSVTHTALRAASP
eukprot:TRINITY_DN1182_c0_g1_i1.p1 TRINITY_DN1182_c0_g1~~TRINITY_DN1182_c0_g1_i1.p1  ORF type:complete len:1203 (+),score=273.17 TRINITY_DN1182_c0_g1_i1:177-3611(+)